MIAHSAASDLQFLGILIGGPFYMKYFLSRGPGVK
jgi:hypothetical protein